MKRTKYLVEQIVAALKEHETGTSTTELCRRLGIASNTLYCWKAKYGGMQASEAKRLKEFEDEEGKLKRLARFVALLKRKKSLPIGF